MTRATTGKVIARLDAEQANPAGGCTDLRLTGYPEDLHQRGWLLPYQSIMPIRSRRNLEICGLRCAGDIGFRITSGTAKAAPGTEKSGATLTRNGV